MVDVTQHDDFDVTDLEVFRVSLKDEATAQGVKLTPLPFIMKACVRPRGGWSCVLQANGQYKLDVGWYR